MVAITELLWERVAAVPCLNKIPADDIYLKFVFVYWYRSRPGRRVINNIYKLSRKIVTRLPADMFTELIATLAPYLNAYPETDKALAKLITMQITCRLKAEDRTARIIFELYPEEQELVMHHVTLSASGIITSSNRDHGREWDWVFTLDTCLYDLNEGKVCPVCYGDDPNLVFILPCKHRIHYACIMEWENPARDCPICQFPLPQWMRLEADLMNVASSSNAASSSPPFNFQQLIIDKFNSLRKLTFNKLWTLV